MASLPSTMPPLLPLALLWGTSGSPPTSTSLSTGNHHHRSSSSPLHYSSSPSPLHLHNSALPGASSIHKPIY